MPGCIALIVAAGRGQRFGGGMPKQYRPLSGKPLLWYSAAAFSKHPSVDAVRAVIHPDDRDLYARATEGLDLLEPVMGGKERQDSARLGLESLASLSPRHVLIHDAARPRPGDALIRRTIEALGRWAGAIPALPVTDTLKRAAPDGAITGTVDRAGLWRAQTPQAFRYGDILAAHRAAAGRALTDDAAVAEAAGLPIGFVLGSEDNIKVTTEDDLLRAGAESGAPWDIRTGLGFDVHRFGPGHAVWLCGLEIPHSHGLIGHSDADVGLHAATDALLGAIGAGDIGMHFPPTDERWRGAPSHVFLKHAADLIAERDGAILNLDITIIAERPKVGPHRTSMVERVAAILGLPMDRISVKATTTERLGFTGREEGIAAQAIATVRLPGR
jgi:2-C-methyl-D-erythritol 4-phosphate cytidylyltransferase/2-C-methyl-D-erythritol 2,4-cyclodiphosphate synthase